ncbi:MAG TPA: rhomboid family intramembrane serine protease [Gemmatimonadales bacterium]|nr:rhomboid family intramembrane serine protease [Gemmatimonadales bacterium]
MSGPGPGAAPPGERAPLEAPGAESEPLTISPGMLAEPDVDGRRDFERGMSYAPPLTLALIAANVGVFGWQLASGTLASREAIVAAGALDRGRVLAGEWWRLLSAPFLHGDPVHLLSNLLALYALGMACEHALGTGGMLVVYLTSAVAGSLASIAAGPGPSVGASGAVFGVLGAVVAVLSRHRRDFRVRDRRIGLVLAAWAVYAIGLGFITPFVDNGAHLGGLLAGMAAGSLARPVLLENGPEAPHPE